MGVKITSQENVVSVFDSVTGIAFGPVFDSEDYAQEFLDWVQAGHEANRTFHHKHDELLFVNDIRIYRADELQALVNLWMDESVASEDTDGNDE